VEADPLRPASVETPYRRLQDRQIAPYLETRLPVRGSDSVLPSGLSIQSLNHGSMRIEPDFVGWWLTNISRIALRFRGSAQNRAVRRL